MTVIFADDPFIAGTSMRASHITQLRTVVNALRSSGGLSAYPFTDANLAGATARAVHVQELRTALAAGRSALALPPVAFTDHPLAAGVLIRRNHIVELRRGVQ